MEKTETTKQIAPLYQEIKTLSISNQQELEYAGELGKKIKQAQKKLHEELEPSVRKAHEAHKTA